MPRSCSQRFVLKSHATVATMRGTTKTAVGQIQDYFVQRRAQIQTLHSNWPRLRRQRAQLLDVGKHKLCASTWSQNNAKSSCQRRYSRFNNHPCNNSWNAALASADPLFHNNGCILCSLYGRKVASSRQFIKQLEGWPAEVGCANATQRLPEMADDGYNAQS